MTRPARMGRGLRLILAALLLAILAPVVMLAVAWSATPGVNDLPARVRGHGPSGAAQPVVLARVAPMVVDALIATEDERFRSNSGVDVIGLMRALPYDATHLSLAQGGSTITEQLAKNLWLHGGDQSLFAKLKDMALALKLDHRWSKDEILEAYLNTAYFGQGAYGIAQASRRYFGRAPGALDEAQATVLVGLVQAPTSYDPYTHPAAARVRQISVLRSLVRVGRLTPAEGERLLSRPLRLANGDVVPGIAGVDLATGPAFDWAGIARAAVLAAIAALTFVLRRTRGFDRRPASRAAAVVGAVVLVAACSEAVRALRVI